MGGFSFSLLRVMSLLHHIFGVDVETHPQAHSTADEDQYLHVHVHVQTNDKQRY